MNEKPAPQAPAPPSVPDYELIRCVGRGSYGEVWLARSVMGTFRGIKIVSRKSFEHHRPFEREFAGMQKFEPISRSHPGFVSILHVGRNTREEYFYYVMEIADDVLSGQGIQPETYLPKTLGQILKNGKLPLAECRRIGSVLADALGHLHKQGLVHRDIKPSNIIFVNGSPKFADIGLVTGIGDRATFVGTEGYIPPEGPGSPAADIYSLGKVLYEIVSGENQDDFPARPTRLVASEAASEVMELNEVILKACHPQSEERFSTGAEMRAALDRLHSSSRAEPSQPTRIADSRPLGKAFPKVAAFGHLDLPPEAHLLAQLERILSALDYPLFRDARADLTVEWARETERRLAQSQFVILLLSRAALRSERMAYVMEAVARARRDNSAGGPALFAVLIQCEGPWPPLFEITLVPARRFLWKSPDDDPLLEVELAKFLDKPGE